MKTHVGWWLLAVEAVTFAALPCMAGDEINLSLKPQGTQAELRLHSRLGLPVSAMYPEYTIQCSTNLQDWFTVAGPLSGSVGVSDEELRVVVPLQGNHAVYRVQANVKLAADGGGGEAVYGYGTEFSKELQRLGQLPLSEFVRLYSLTNQYLPQISFDPTTAEFWNLFNANTNFQLNAQEFAVFQTNGFVVSERLGTYSFGDALWNIFKSDLPVYFSADAALQAWHFSYRAMLEELEETRLSPMLREIILGMRARLPELWAEASNTAVTNGILDADYFLTVAAALLTTNRPDLSPTVLPPLDVQTSLSVLEWVWSPELQDWNGDCSHCRRPSQTYQDIGALTTKYVNLFGTNRWMDFSQFQVRGHYDKSWQLSRYFRAMMWCALADFRFTGSTNDNSLRELAGAVALSWLLERSGQYSNWLKFDRTVEMFVGLPDSLNFGQLGGLLDAAGIHSPTNLATHAALENLQAQLMSGQLGLQSITSGYHTTTPCATAPIKLPRSFTVMGQRFVLDSWGLGQCVFDRIVWDDDGIPNFQDLVGRRVPSALDIAFGVLGNSHIVPEIAARISRTNLTKADGRDYWRDGYRYQHNLAAVRNVVDGQNASAWTNSIYSLWLACLRELSAPTTGPECPETMRTRAWAMKDLNTQLASWTQLRHDTVLYVKQSATTAVLCSYPDGFVEPRPLFWQRMQELAQRTRGIVATLPSSGWIAMQKPPPDSGTTSFSFAQMHTNRLRFLDHFAVTMGTLRTIAEKELARQPLATNEVAFLQRLITDPFTYTPTIRLFNGWYPNLFYADARESLRTGVWGFPVEYQTDQGPDKYDALVTDVHTDTFDTVRGDPGGVLHEGVGRVNMLMMAVDCGPGDQAIYVGPVLSHYEFELGPDTRLTDSEWQDRASTTPPPEWTRGFLVPKR